MELLCSGDVSDVLSRSEEIRRARREPVRERAKQHFGARQPRNPARGLGMKRASRTVAGGLLVALCGITTGCSDDTAGGSDVTAQQSQAIWAATESALAAVQDPLVSGVDGKDRARTSRNAMAAHDGGLRDGLRDRGLRDRGDTGLDRSGDGGSAAIHVTGTISSFQVSGTVSNPSGEGTATISGSGGKKTTGWGVTLTITFSGWEANGLTINGPLDVSYAITSLVPVKMSLTVKGTPQATIGKLTVPVVVDVKVEVNGKTTTACGTVAGNPVGSGAC